MRRDVKVRERESTKLHNAWGETGHLGRVTAGAATTATADSQPGNYPGVRLMVFGLLRLGFLFCCPMNLHTKLSYVLFHGGFS